MPSHKIVREVIRQRQIGRHREDKVPKIRIKEIMKEVKKVVVIMRALITHRVLNNLDPPRERVVIQLQTRFQNKAKSRRRRMNHPTTNHHIQSQATMIEAQRTN